MAPLQPAVQPTPELVASVAARAAVPVWLPWPLPHGWLVTGIAHAGDERTGPVAVAVALSGPNPVGGMGELLLVAEEPGVGLGAHVAGLSGPDPGAANLVARPCDAKIEAAGHPTPLWLVDGVPDDRAVFVGESRGCWLYAVLWPASAGALLLEDPALTDARELLHELGLLPVGALCPRLAALSNQ